jgi:hypothetical protein
LKESPRSRDSSFFNLRDLTIMFLSSTDPFLSFVSLNLPISNDLVSPTLYSVTAVVTVTAEANSTLATV